MIKAILFDIDDTLIKTFETKKETLKYLGRKYYGINLTDEQIRRAWGKPIRELLTTLYPNLKDVEEAFERYVVERKNYPTEAYDDVLLTLLKLKKKYLLGLISSKSKRYLKEDLEIANIPEDLFFIIQTEDDNAAHKPDPKVFSFALEKLKAKEIAKSNVLYIGDRLLDYYAARDAGIKFYGILNNTTMEKDFKKEGILVISHLSELLKYLPNI
jgi:HAD superfamily hydrolase (TIGR01549 family)